MDEPLIPAVNLRNALRAGAFDLARDVRLLLDRCLVDGAEPAERLISLFGEMTANQFVRVREALGGDEELRRFASTQLGRLISFHLHRHAHARAVEVEAGETGHLLCEGMQLSIREVSRFDDWGSRPFTRSDQINDQIEVARSLNLKVTIGQVVTGMRYIAASEAYRDLRTEMDVATWYIEGSGRSLELFFRDCLMRAGLTCRLASLQEDVLEATDLRVHIPETNRKRGTRIQVSWLSRHDQFRRKRHLIPYSSTMVMLCPFTLAQEWLWRSDNPQEAMPEQYSQTPQLDEDEAAAIRLRDRISLCIRENERKPLGPAPYADQEIVDLIGEFVTREGLRANTALRERQETRPSYGVFHEYIRGLLIREAKLRNQGS